MDIKISLHYDIVENKDQSIVWYWTNFFSKDSFRSSFSLLPASLLRPNDFILLPDLESVRKSWKWVRDFLKYSDNQVAWYTMRSNLKDYNSSHEDIIRVFQGRNVIICNMWNDEYLIAACEKVKISIYTTNMLNLPDKRWIHPTVPGSPHFSNLWDVEFPSEVLVPRGYTCLSHEELVKAKSLLQSAGIKKFVIKSSAE